MTICYTDQDINDIKSLPTIFYFDQNILDKIKKIADEVGAPEYMHTPQFQKKEKNKQNISDDDWNMIRNFKTTKIVKREGIDASFDKIRKHLNKLSTNTYDKLKITIIEEMRLIYGNTNISSVDNDLENTNLYTIGNDIFAIASSSKFYSKMYAKLYSELIKEFNIMKIVFDKNLTEFNKVFRDISYCDPKQYDIYCENNKKNEKRRALGLFYVNLMIEGIITQDTILDIISDVQEYLINKLDVDGCNAIVDELSELLYIMIIPCKDIYDKKMDNIINNVEKISKLKSADMKSLTNKTVFKHMDILDAI